MGSEFGQRSEWYHERSLDWHLLQFEPHQGIQRWVRDLNHFLRNEKALYECDFSLEGFEWIDASDWQQGVISFIRRAPSTDEKLIVICNLTPVVRKNYRIGVPDGGYWKEVLSSDDKKYGGSHLINSGQDAQPEQIHGKKFSISLTLPSLSFLFFKK